VPYSEAYKFIAWNFFGGRIGVGELGLSQHSQGNLYRLVREKGQGRYRRRLCDCEVDETKIGGRRNNCGQIIEVQWVFVGSDRETGDFFMGPVEDRSKDTFLPTVQDKIAAGTTIVSDCWRAYDCLNDSGYQHLKVNHSRCLPWHRYLIKIWRLSHVRTIEANKVVVKMKLIGVK